MVKRNLVGFAIIDNMAKESDLGHEAAVLGEMRSEDIRHRLLQDSILQHLSPFVEPALCIFIESCSVALDWYGCDPLEDLFDFTPGFLIRRPIYILPSLGEVGIHHDLHPLSQPIVISAAHDGTEKVSPERVRLDTSKD